MCARVMEPLFRLFPSSRMSETDPRVLTFSCLGLKGHEALFGVLMGPECSLNVRYKFLECSLNVPGM